MKSAKPAENDTQTADATRFFVWKVPGTSAHIRVSLEAVGRIREYLAEAVRGGLEAGGLLVGNPRASGTEITGFAPISRKSEPGPYFVLSDDEKTELLRYIEEVNHSLPEQSVVGYFRSDVRDGVSLYDEDKTLIEACFPDASNVFLVVHTPEGSPATAGFFFSDDGGVFSSFSFMEFDFDEKILASELYSNSRSDLSTSGSEQPESGGLFAVASPETGNRSALSLRLLAPAVASVGLICVAAYFFTNRTRETESAAQGSRTRGNALATLGLTVAGSGSEINISWDAKSPLVTGARVALLTIEDGAQRRDLPLTKEQLLSSKLVYTRTTDTVQVALETYGEDGSVARENVISMGNASAKAAATQYETVVATIAPPSAAVQETKRAPTRDFIAPRQRVSASQSPSTAPPVEPPTGVTGRLDLRQMPPTQPLPAAAPPAIPRPAQTSSPSAFATRPSGTIQVVPQTPPRPPVPVRQVRPVLPDNVKAMLTTRASVKVRIQVDASGRVTGADPIVTGGSLERILSAAAASAARMWIFEPAREGDRRVPSELTVEFTFVPEKAKR